LCCNIGNKIHGVLAHVKKEFQYIFWFRGHENLIIHRKYLETAAHAQPRASPYFNVESLLPFCRYIASVMIILKPNVSYDHAQVVLIEVFIIKSSMNLKTTICISVAVKPQESRE
jgi:hypothetical protein